ncbi:NAD(P)H-hydrate dehydratase [Parasulfitobacter algicola]|uniref:Bifunctional NAD(P)H-hydrate repair enzyme n=1 Tax=Parasulfitobacter algicola TaxID=2614809 RepID=A0ABX2IL70_9RHOB|nr:NAD(P)H-hydrate dehydratase [Sulfitobacter algicola]NSX53609.1 NAD(P)H-hydrate dehydratase [Sulfitobacter algicola]
MIELVTSAQMRAIEQAAIKSGDVTGLELMERAGRGVFDAVFEEWPELAKTSHRTVVLCGPGNNGGDGFVVARLLKEWGWEVEVFLYGDPEKLPPDARVNYERWGELGQVAALTKDAFAASVERALSKADYHPDSMDDNRGPTTVYIDALFGTGFTRGFDDDLLAVRREWHDLCYEYSVAVDIQSGLCADSGFPIKSDCFFSKLVVTFGFAKVGHYLGQDHYDVEKLKIVDLDLSAGNLRDDPIVNLFDEWNLELDLKGFFEDGLQKSQRTHKYGHGHALVLSGPSGQTGAARLAARGALRIGAGLVTVGCPPDALVENATQLTAIMLKPVADGTALTKILKDDRLNALCIGPGLGISDDTRRLVSAALKSGRATVLDADALTILSQNPDLFDLLHKNCVLTPHAGEFARLFPDIAEKLNAPATTGPAYSKVNATRDAAKRAGCTILFKGPDTVIASPDGSASINSAQYERAAPWLATAGSGDVLAGFITGLLARGFQPMQAAETAAWLHVECALQFGPGLIAEDLPEQLPGVFRSLGM